MERDMEKAKIQAGGDTKLLRELEKNIKIHKYIGETNRSTYERGWEHQYDYTNLSTKSHMLKHTVEHHPSEPLNNIKFGIRILRTAKTSINRQIYESVIIQGAKSTTS